MLSLKLQFHPFRGVQAKPSKAIIHFAAQPNWGFNADTNIGHGFAIFMAYVGALRTCGAPAPLTLVVRPAWKVPIQFWTC